eukprot:CCRYP_016037-RA/>CCRYP_016037-RA protein AED:0.06 eAED:0.06 QI:353/1/1/1/1/1/10/132/1126
MSTLPVSQDARIIGRRREYNEAANCYGPWSNISIGPCEAEKPLLLSRGGKVVFRQNVLTCQEQTTLTAAMQNCKLFRQYSIGETYAEPRSHVLLSSKIKSIDKMNGSQQGNPGYAYHGIKMKAYPLDQIPEVERLANRLARFYGIDEWNTGVDLVAYKDGEDRMGWHADDTQGEALVVCVVVSCPEPRPLRIRPKKRYRPLSDGDEEIEIAPSAGDAYDMDGVMQIGYEHCLPKKAANASHRFAIVLRNGDVGDVSQDSGQEVINMSPPQHFASHVENQIQYPPNQELDLVTLMKRVRYKHPTVTFGQAECLEEGKCYNRRYLYSIYAHRTDQRGVNGNQTMGSDSIVVSRQSDELREEDGLGWLLYTSTRQQGALALCISHTNGSPIRVFRSSRLESDYSPPPMNSANNQQGTSYRYDGLYRVVQVFDVEGNATDKKTPCGNEHFTFFLDRLPANNCAKYHNELSILDLCHKINIDRLDTKHCFVVPRPRPYYDKLCTLSDLTTKGDRKKASLFPAVDNASSPSRKLGNHSSNSQQHHHSNTCHEFLSTTLTQHTAAQKLQQDITLSHAPSARDLFSVALGTFGSTYHLECGSHDSNQSSLIPQRFPIDAVHDLSGSQLPIRFSYPPTSQDSSIESSSMLMPRLHHSQNHEMRQHFAFLPPVDAQLSLLNRSNEGEARTMLSPGHPLMNAPVVSRVDRVVIGKVPKQAPAAKGGRKKALNKSETKALGDDEAQEKRDMKKLVMLLEADYKKEKRKKMQSSTTPATEQDLATAVLPIEGFTNQAHTCKVKIKKAGKNSPTKARTSKTLRGEEAQGKRVTKNLVMQLKDDEKREKLEKMLHAGQDVGTHESLIGGVVNQAPACRVNGKRTGLGKKSKGKGITRKSLRDEEAQEKKDMKKIVMQLEADEKREKLEMMQVLVTRDARRELEAHALRLQKKLLVALKKECKANRPQRKISKKTGCSRPLRKEAIVCIKKQRKKAFLQEIKKNTDPKATKRNSTNEPRRMGMKLPPKVADEIVRPGSKISQTKSLKKANFKEPSPKAARKSSLIRQPKNNSILRKVVMRNIQIACANSAKRLRPITPRLQIDSEKGNMYLTPHLIAVGPGKTRGKNVDVKVTVTFKVDARC